MIQDCLRIFEKELNNNEGNYEDAYVIDNHFLKPGTYLLVELTDKVPKYKDKLEISKEENYQGKELYQYFRELDYYSNIFSADKPVADKKIHSNNYLSFFIKKMSIVKNIEGNDKREFHIYKEVKKEEKKITYADIKKYYDTLKNPFNKCHKSITKLCLEQDIGEPNDKIIDIIYNWISKELCKIIREQRINMDKKEDNKYLKIFFVYKGEKETREAYQLERERYIINRIYNNNKYNLWINDKLYGLPKDNMQMNSKKPFLSNDTRGIKVPYLLSLEEVKLQNKFFDYLLGMASIGKVHIYFDNRNQKIISLKSTEFPKGIDEGYFLRIVKNKVLEIHNFDILTQYSFYLVNVIDYQEIVKADKDDKSIYGIINTMEVLAKSINKIFFSGDLSSNYFTDATDISIQDSTIKQLILMSRDRLFNWFYKGNSAGIDSLLDRVSLALIKHSISNETNRKDCYRKARHQLNLRWALMNYFGHKIMEEEEMSEMRNNLKQKFYSREDWEFVDDREYYYAVGQVVSFLISKLRGKEIPDSLINPFLNAKKDKIIKDRIQYLYQKVNYDIDSRSIYFRNLLSHITEYTPSGKVQQDILIAGFTAFSIMYEKKETTNLEEEKQNG